MIERAQVIGAGRVGSAMAARLRERALDLSSDDPELILLCVPDRAIAEVAAAVAPGPWIVHVSGATPLAALDPHRRRFGLHPLQTFARERGAEQLDGAYAAVTAESEEAAEAGSWLARTLGLEPLLRRTIENGFVLTGPIARGEWETVDAHLAAIRAERPQLEPMYVALADTTKALL